MARTLRMSERADGKVDAGPKAGGRTTVGFIGLGNMGRGIASRLLAAGHDVVVWNRSRPPVDDLVAKGARAGAGPAEAARAPVLHSMLADDAAMADVLRAGGVLEALPAGSVHVNHATISVALAKELAALHRARGIGYVAAPVFGRPEAAAAGKLHVLAAGAPADVERVRPLLDAIGQSVWLLGDAPERANVVKIAGNFMISSAIETLGEATALARAHGVSAKDLVDVMTGTLFAAPVYKTYGAMIAERRYEPAGFAMTLGLKDTRLTLAAADDAHVPMPMASLIRDAFLDALAHGDAERDWSGLAEVTARRANLGARSVP
jgi:3-hydroxyisobutyrate dehydrogenase-like beta-hydroxyacid dehydrogenase